MISQEGYATLLLAVHVLILAQRQRGPSSFGPDATQSASRPSSERNGEGIKWNRKGSATIERQDDAFSANTSVVVRYAVPSD